MANITVGDLARMAHAVFPTCAVKTRDSIRATRIDITKIFDNVERIDDGSFGMSEDHVRWVASGTIYTCTRF